jgi:hypothetical protein
MIRNGRNDFEPRLAIPTRKGDDVGTSSATMPIVSRFTPFRATAARHCLQTVTSDDPAEKRTSAPQFGHWAARALKVGGS